MSIMTIFAVGLGLAAVGVAVAAVVEREEEPADVQTFGDFADFVAYVNTAALDPVRVDGPPPDKDPVRVDPDRPQVRFEKSVKPSVKKSGPKAKGPMPRTMEITTFGRFLREKEGEIEIPEIPIPPQIAAAGGPVIQGAIAGLESLRAGLKEALGAKYVATANGADVVVLDTRPFGEAKVDLELSWSRPGHYPVRVMRFSGKRGSTGEIPNVEIEDPGPPGDPGLGKNLPLVEPAIDAEYLRTGMNTTQLDKTRWIAPEPLLPAVQVSRVGKDLELVLYLPARGGYKNVEWRATWTMKKTG